MSELEHASQAPELAQQIVAYGLALNGLAVGGVIILLVVVWVAYAKTYNKFKNDEFLLVSITVAAVVVTSACIKTIGGLVS